MDKKVSLSLFTLQKQYGDLKALEIAASIDVHAVDFSLDIAKRCDYRNPDSIYSKRTD